MPAGFLWNALGDAIGAGQRRKRNRRGDEALDEAIQRILSQAGPSPSPQQQQALQRQLDPLLQQLTGNQQAPQQSPIPTGQPSRQMQDYIANAQTIQDAKRGTSGLDYLLARTDPQYAAELEAQQQKNRAADYDFNRAQQLAMQDDVEADAWQQVLANPNMSQDERNLLQAVGRKTAGAELLKRSGTAGAPYFEGTGIEAQALNRHLNSLPEHMREAEANRLARERLQRQTTVPTPQGTYIQPGYTLPDAGGSQGTTAPPPADNPFVPKPDPESVVRDQYVAGSIFDREMELLDIMGREDFDPTGLRQAAGTSLPGGNAALTASGQQLRDVASDWAAKVTFLESGATAREEEVQRKIDTFFPTFGDKPETVRAKNRRRLSVSKSAFDKALTRAREEGNTAQVNELLRERSQIEAQIALMDAEDREANKDEDMGGGWKYKGSK